jgi:hypothetical protein
MLVITWKLLSMHLLFICGENGATPDAPLCRLLHCFLHSYIVDNGNQLLATKIMAHYFSSLGQLIFPH